MKKLIGIIGISILALTGCGNDPVQDELINYMNKDMKPLSKTEDKVMKAYESVTGANYSDDDKLYNKLSDEIIPEYNEFISELEHVDVKSKEILKLHEKYIDAANTQQQAFVKIEEAIEKQDSGLIAKANEMLAKARKEMRTWQNDIKDLADKHDVSIEEN